MYNAEIKNVRKLNPMLMTDFYKTIHHLAYITKLDYLVSYWTPRMTRIEGVDKVVSFGQQAMVKEYLINLFNDNFFNRDWEDVKAEYEELISNTMTVQASDTSEMKRLYDLGYLPIRIKSVAEGERVYIKTPMFEVTNTVKGFGWLVNYLETYMSVNIWFPMTTATIAYEYRKIVNKYFEKTVENGIPATAWPCATLLACSWDTDLIYEVGAAGGAEIRENNLEIGQTIIKKKYLIIVIGHAKINARE